MDWTRCLICQTDTEEALKCRLNANGTVPVQFQPDETVSTLVITMPLCQL